MRSETGPTMRNGMGANGSHFRGQGLSLDFSSLEVGSPGSRRSARKRSNSLSDLRSSVFSVESALPVRKDGEVFNRQEIALFVTALAGGLLFVLAGLFLLCGDDREALQAGMGEDGAVRYLSGSSGIVFSGRKTREYTGKRLRPEDVCVDDEGNPPILDECTLPSSQCIADHWAVFTTVRGKTNAINTLLDLPGWCVVVVGDTGTPSHSFKTASGSLTYLSVDDQKSMTSSCLFLNHLPWRHFGRKNLGYLYAIANGATEIFDVDDDNVVSADSQIGMMSVGSAKFISPGQKNTRRSARAKASRDQRPPATINPYPIMGTFAEWNSHAQGTPRPGDRMIMRSGVFLHEVFAWPRGFLLSEINTRMTYELVVEQRECLETDRAPISDAWSICADAASDVVVRQALANQHPDVDAIFRLTSPHNQFRFTAKHGLVAMPLKSFVPYNAQATTHLEKAFWGMLLPITVPGRVSDIWRGYSAQALFRVLNYRVGFTDALVSHERSGHHNLLADFQAEEDLYSKTSALLTFLGTWSDTVLKKHYSLPLAMEDLWIEMYERGFIEEDDVHLMRSWVMALVSVKYKFPDLRFPS